jgi:hypothetical protein
MNLWRKYLILKRACLKNYYKNSSSYINSYYNINKYQSYENEDIIIIPLAFHTLPLNKLSEKFNEINYDKIKKWNGKDYRWNDSMYE